MSSISESEQLNPITINSKGEVIEYRQVRISNWSRFFEVKAFDNSLDDIDINLQRRHLTVLRQFQLGK